MKNNILWKGGLLLIAAALCFAGYNLWDSYRAGENARQILAVLETKIPADSAREQTPAETEPAATDELPAPDTEMPEVTAEGQSYIGTLEIPALGLTLPIISRWSEEGLKIAPCRYQGSAYQDNLILAGHNYNTHFGRLKELTVGDRVTFTDAAGNRFDYAVTGTERLSGTAVEDMEAGDWALTLFTCTTGGRARFTVRCGRV